MPREVVIHFDTERPTRDEVECVLEDTLRGLATEIRWSRDRFFVTLPGAPSWPFERVGPATEAQRASWKELALQPDGTPGLRTIEVWLDLGQNFDQEADDGDDDRCIFVMTRFADDVTNAIGDEIARLLSHGWSGRINDP